MDVSIHSNSERVNLDLMEVVDVKDGNKIAKHCKHAIGGKVNEIGEVLCFCELTDNLENVTLGDCIGNCESQEE